MRKVVTFLGASLVLAWAVPSMAQPGVSDRVAGYQTPDSFKDVPAEHWAYEAVENLRGKGILIGYPDGLYRGKRTLTRYEFAVALRRLLDSIGNGQVGAKGDPGPQGVQGPTGEKGDRGDKGDPGSGIAADDLDALRKLTNEFKSELASLGVDMNAVKAKLDRLAKDVAELKARLDKMPVLGGTVFMGVRSDRANTSYVDKDGRPAQNSNTPYWSSLVNQPVVVHAVEVSIKAKLGGDATARVSLVNDNYKNYVNNMLGGVIGDSLNTEPAGDTWLDIAEINAPFGGFGRDGSVTIGRMGFNLTPLTLWKPDVDTYFDNPIVDDSKYRMDGFSLNTKIGSLGLQAFAGQTRSVKDANGVCYYTPGAVIADGRYFWGSSSGGYGPLTPGNKPTGQSGQSYMPVDQLGGVRLSLPLNFAEDSHVGVTALGGWAINSGAAVTNVQIIGADTKFKLGDKADVNAEWAKTISGTGRLGTLNTGQNNAATGAVGITTGGLSLSAGYKYIDPKFYAPGFWGRIGNWINPTNVKGPILRASYDFSPVFGINLGGDMYTAARNLSAANGIGNDDEINRVLVGVRWDVSKAFQTTVDWEGVYWKLQGAHNGLPTLAGTVHPVEQYLTFGTGYHLSDNTLLKLGYQIGSLDGKVFNGGPGVGSKYWYNAFTSQVAIKF